MTRTQSAILHDARNALGLVAGALLIGWGVNALRSQPLPFRYETKAARLAAATEHLEKVNPTAATHKKPILPLEIAKVEAISKKEAPGILIDARSSTFFEMGHIPNAINLSRKEFETRFQQERERLKPYQSVPVVVYCSGADCEDSRLVAEALQSLAFEEIYLFEGGWDAWEEAGLPAATEELK